MKKERTCPYCGKKYRHRGRYCCEEHGILAMKESNRQLKEKEGPIYEKWKARLKASISKLK